MNVMEMFSLKGKVALVTGAGDRIGYGAQCAEALYEAGAEVYIASRNMDKLNAFAAEHPGMKVLQFDLEDETQVRNIIPQIIASSGKLDILVNNAVARTALAKWDLSMAEFDRSLHANASALFLLTRSAAEAMKSGGGNIINIGSYMGIYQFHRSAFRLGFALSGYHGRQGHVFNHAELRKKGVELKNKADAAIAKRGKLAVRQRKHICAVIEHSAGVGTLQSAHNLQQSGFSGTAGPHNGNNFLFIYPK